MKLTDLCEVLRNWFDVSRYYGKFEIKNETIHLDFLQEGQYFRIVGSVFNDGAYCYDDELKLRDEAFKGAIWAMAVPQNVLELLDNINDFITENAEAINSPYSSESFGGYSYSKESGGANGEMLTWQSKFKRDLERWQKI